MRSSPDSGSAQRSADRRLLRVAVVFVYGACLIYPFLLPFNLDEAWLVYAAGELVRGARFGVDIVEINPPLILWISIPPAMAAEHLGIADAVVFKTYVILLAAGSLYLIRTILRRWAPDDLTHGGYLLLLPLAAIGMAGYNFGEREHIMFVLAVPYLFLSIAQADSCDFSRRFRILVGALAAFGFLLKPYFLGVPVAVETYLMLRTRTPPWRRVELWALVGIGASYAVAIVSVTPEYFAVVRIARETYTSFANPAVVFIRSPAFMGPVAVALLCWAVPIPNSHRSPRSVLSLAVTALLVSAVLQRKGWLYHLYPALAAAILLGGGVLLGQLHELQTWQLRRRNALRLGSIVSLATIFAVALPVLRLKLFPRVSEALVPIVRREVPTGTVWVASTELGWGFPLVNETGLEWGSRFPSLHMLPGFYPRRVRGEGAVRYRKPEEQSVAERWFFNAVAADFVSFSPELLMVDTSAYQPGFRGARFDYLGYFSQDPHFARALSLYRPIGGVRSLLLYKREANAASIPARSEVDRANPMGPTSAPGP